ncbi:MAG: helix-turn-helix transcriptional regulator [Elusimicrobiota bacterium]
MSTRRRANDAGPYIVNGWDAYYPASLELRPTPSAERQPPARRLVDVQELSLYLSMPVASIYTYVHAGKIPSRCIVRLSRALRFDLLEIDKWIDGGRRGRSA